MSHSKGTTNYNLPLFTKDDRPAWLTDFNSAMQEVDTVMKRTSDAARPDLLEAAQQEAAAAMEKATDAQTKANGALQKSGGAMNGTLDMNEHALTNVQEVELPTSGNGLYIGSVVQPDGTGGARLTGITGNGAAFVKPDTQDSYVPVRVGAPQTGDDAVNKNSLNGTLSSYMKKSGATMSGALILSGEPTEELQAATKKYVDDHAGQGGVTQEYVDNQVATRLPIAGGTMTGDLKVLESPQSDTSAVSKSYAQGLFANALNTANAAKQTAEAALPKSGGTMTGALTLNGAPTSDLQAATKKYVDDSVATIEDSTLIFQGTSTGIVNSNVTQLEMSKFKAIRYVGTSDSRGYLSIFVGTSPNTVEIMPYGSATIEAGESRIIDIPFTANGQYNTSLYRGIACLAGLNDTSPMIVQLYDGISLYVFTNAGTVKIYGLK